VVIEKVQVESLLMSPKKIVSLLLSVKSIQKIEKLRNDKNRSQFVNDLIKQF